MERERKIKRANRERAEKTRGDWGRRPLPQSPLVFFPALSLAFFFARGPLDVPLSERLEQANSMINGKILVPETVSTNCIMRGRNFINCILFQRYEEPFFVQGRTN